jgi:hypothetical protein
MPDKVPPIREAAMEETMKTLLVGAAFLIGAISSPAMAQTNPDSTQPNASSSEQQYQPGEGGRSKVGVPGQPGNKSGPTDKSNNGAAAGDKGTMKPQSGAAAGSDESKVPGLPGNKSGASEKAK